MHFVEQGLIPQLERALGMNTFALAQSLILREKIIDIVYLLDGEIVLE